MSNSRELDKKKKKKLHNFYSYTTNATTTY